MKISKVNHIKTAVSNKGNIQKGILYIDPARIGRCVQNTRDHINNRSNDARRLYSIFNQPKEIREKNKRRAVQKIIRDGNIIFKEVTRTRSFNTKTLESVIRPDDKDRPSKEMISESIALYTRKSLSGNASLKAIEQVLLYRYGFIEWNSIDHSMLCDFLDVLNDDYNKTSQKPLYERSISNQNLVVQPEALTGSLVLQLSGKEKKTEKENFNRFLFDYAVLDEGVRKDYRIKLRRLLVLFFYGKDEVPEESFDEWQDHAARRGCKDNFISISDEINEEAFMDKLYLRELSGLIRKDNIRRYRDSVTAARENETGLYFNDQNVNVFWIHHMESSVERILKHLRKETLFKLQLGYLSEKVWKDIINYLSIKYIAIGKAVYHFMMQELSKPAGKIDLITLPEDHKNGFSSFEYEMIKAEETLQRNIAVYVLFATNHLGDNTVNEREDFLEFKPDKELKIKDNIRKNVLQFFGGASSWAEFDFNAFYTAYKADYSDRDFLEDLRIILASMRNESFHFRTENHNYGNWNQALIAAMFSHESKRAVQLLKDKLYSNNLVMFYKNKDLRMILDRLYSKPSVRSSQVPSFQRVFVRKNFPVVIREVLHMQASLDQEDLIKWQSGLYYLLKEVYYCLFLQDDFTKSLFLKTVRDLKGKDEHEEKAARDFQSRIDELKDFSLAEICQTIMTDQNLQNSSNRKAKTTFASSRNPDIFKHYKMLLYRSLQEAFVCYLDGINELGFIKAPEKREIPLKTEEFLPDWSAPLYQELSEALAKSTELQRWYVLGKFLSPKQLNHLVGALRTYVQFTQDIKRRAKETENPLREYDNQNIKDILAKVEILDVCLKTAGTVSLDPLDYFDSADAYADYLKKYLNYEDTVPEENLSDSIRLRTFCGESVESDPEQKIGLFYDEGNLILNRNLILSKLFGAGELLPDIIRRVTRKDIDAYYQSRKKIEKYLASGVCKTAEEQIELKRYQELKNKIEFRNIMEYSELIDELHGQLVNWTYLRERDLMYFQLGFHYLALHNSEEKPESYRFIHTEDGKDITGAILYQIAASYTNGLYGYIYDESRSAYVPDIGNETKSTGAKLDTFTEYTASGLGKDRKWDYYTAGLELFENISEHKDIIDLRNGIDHFHYYSRHEYSMLGLYSEVFDRFFTYDMKYQKNVVNMLENILLQHMVILRPSFGTGSKKIGGKKKGVNKECASIVLGEESIYSDDFTYKLGDGSKTVTIPAKNEEFLRDVAAILYYQDKADGNIVKVRSVGKEKFNTEEKEAYSDKGRSLDKKSRPGKGMSNRQKENTKGNESFGYSMGELFKNITIS